MFVNQLVKDTNPDVLFDERNAVDVLDFWLHNLKQIKDTITQGTDKLNLPMIGVYSLCEAISYNLYGKSSRYYYEKVLKIPHSHLLYEIFRNGFTHSFKPNRLQYEDCSVTWAWSSDTSPSGFRPFYFGEKDETGSYIFKPDSIVEYIEFSKTHKQFSITLDRLAARVEADLIKRKLLLDKADKMYFASGKILKSDSPSGAVKPSETP